MGDGVAERTKALAVKQPALVRYLDRGRHFSSGKLRCPENKRHHPSTRGMAETYGCPIRNPAKTQHTRVPTYPI